MRPTCRKSGFTLIELLVVIAIIALLVAILVPMLSTAREMSRKVYCQTNMHSISLGISQYVGDNLEIVPPIFYGPDKHASNWMWWWADMFVRYIDAGAHVGKYTGGWSDASVALQPLNDDCRTWIGNMGVVPSRLFDCPTLRKEMLYGGTVTLICPYSVDYAWNFAEVYTGNSVTWSYYAAYSGASTDIQNGTKAMRRFSHFGQASRMCPMMESGQSLYFDMAGGWGDTTIAATILAAPHLKTLNMVYYDGHVGNMTAMDYTTYIAQPLGTRSYPFYCLGMPTR